MRKDKERAAFAARRRGYRAAFITGFNACCISRFLSQRFRITERTAKRLTSGIRNNPAIVRRRTAGNSIIPTSPPRTAHVLNAPLTSDHSLAHRRRIHVPETAVFWPGTFFSTGKNSFGNVNGSNSGG